MGFFPALAANMLNMVGVGPFITIPLILAAMGGPQALLGWVVGAVIALCDGLVWAELGAAMPGSGGSYEYLQQAYGPQKAGRLDGLPVSVAGDAGRAADGGIRRALAWRIMRII